MPQISKPSNSVRPAKGSREQETNTAVLSTTNSATKNTRKLSGHVGHRYYSTLFYTSTFKCERWQDVVGVFVFFLQKHCGRRSSSSVDGKGAGCSVEQPQEEGIASGSALCVSAHKMGPCGSLSDGSERGSGPQDSSNDADSEASETEWAPHTSCSSHVQSHPTPTFNSSTVSVSTSPSSSSKQVDTVEPLVSSLSKVSLGCSSGDSPPSLRCSLEEPEETKSRENLRHHYHQGAFQALSQSYNPGSKECSIQSCLHQFTSVELLMGNNKLLCESCTERRQKQTRKSSSAGGQKSLHVSVYPANSSPVKQTG